MSSGVILSNADSAKRSFLRKILAQTHKTTVQALEGVPTARGEGDGRDYSEVRARAPNGSQEVAARVRGGHVTARTRIGVQLGRLIDTVRRSRKEAG